MSAGRAVDRFEADFDSWIERLKKIVRIPSVSAAGYPSEEMARCADAVAADLRAAGLENVRIIPYGRGYPYVYADWLHAPGSPTLLLYAHYDVQPPGRPEFWETPAFDPTVRSDGRLYGRGAADDKAGVVLIAAAIESCLRANGRIPINVKVLIEGEEEIGSDGLESFLLDHREMLACDSLVIMDSGNLEEGLPSLTFALRGIVNVDVEVAGLSGRVHSGQFGGPVPDPVMALCKILSRLVDEDGVPCDPGVRKGIRDSDPVLREKIARLPFDEAEFRRTAGLLAGVRLAGEAGYSVYERLWTRPCLTVIAMEASPLATASNQIIESARARVSVRIVANQDPAAVRDALVAAILRDPPWGVRVAAHPAATGIWWFVDPVEPAYQAAQRALERGYGKETALIGSGGSIPFVKTFQDSFGGVPCLLMGVEDPMCRAHGENESLSLAEWKKGTHALIHLFDELAASGRPSRP